MHSYLSTVIVDDSVSTSAQDLIWDVFFASRQRGVKLQVHFPWMEDRALTTCLSVEYSKGAGVSETVAAMVVKQADLGLCGLVGLVGLVCVREDHRGKGLSSQLLRSATDTAKARHLDSLVLWTGKPSVYERHGFITDSTDKFCEVSVSRGLPFTKIEFCVEQFDSLGNQHVGLPPYATAMHTFRSTGASLVVLATAHGDCLAQWEGAPQELIALLRSALPEKWTINAPEGSVILDLLTDAGYSILRRDGSCRMVLPLNKKPPSVPYINLLDRI